MLIGKSITYWIYEWKIPVQAQLNATQSLVDLEKEEREEEEEEEVEEEEWKSMIIL